MPRKKSPSAGRPGRKPGTLRSREVRSGPGAEYRVGPGYNFGDVLALTSASKSNLLHWSNIGIITPAIEDIGGKGYPRRYSPLNVIEVELCTFVNQFRVPAEVIRGVANVFRDFHYSAVALHEEVEQAPLLVMPPHLALFKSATHRQTTAKSFWLSQFPHHPTEEDMHRAADYAKAMARQWAYLRTGPRVRGISDSENQHFLGLFIGDEYAVVALDPPDVGKLVYGSAIVIDLSTVVFRVGERCRKLGVELGAW